MFFSNALADHVAVSAIAGWGGSGAGLLESLIACRAGVSLVVFFCVFHRAQG